MKAFLIFGMAVLCMGSVQAQKVLNKNKEVMGYITDEGVVQDSSHQILGYFIDNGTIANADYKPLGYIKPDGIITSFDSRLLGYYQNNTVYNAKKEALGSIAGNGTVYDAKGLPVGYLKNVSHDVGAVAVFFFFHLAGVDYFNDPEMIRTAAGGL